LTEQEFNNEFTKRRETDVFWKGVSEIQTTLKSKVGIGRPLKFQFTAPLFEKEKKGSNGFNPLSFLSSDPKMERAEKKGQSRPMKGEPGAIHLVDNNYDIENLDVDFDFKQFGEDASLMRSQPVSYCIKVCHKIGFYVQEIYQYQILRMNVEFYQDDNGKIYLFHASDIYVREAKKATRAQKKKMEE
jgi:hypothetical protein